MTNFELDNENKVTEQSPSKSPVDSDMINHSVEIPQVQKVYTGEHQERSTLVGSILVALSLFFTGIGVFIIVTGSGETSGLPQAVGQVWTGIGVVLIIASLIIYSYLKKR